MIITVISDSHGNIETIKKLLPTFQKSQMVVHLGDHFYDMDSFKGILSDKLITVYGNCDGGGEDVVINKEGIKILICHGDKYHVKTGLYRLYLRAKEVGATLVLYGHTHIPKIDFQDGVTLINPGALSKFGNKTYCQISLTDGVINPTIYNLE